MKSKNPLPQSTSIKVANFGPSNLPLPTQFQNPAIPGGQTTISTASSSPDSKPKKSLLREAHQKPLFSVAFTSTLSDYHLRLTNLKPFFKTSPRKRSKPSSLTSSLVQNLENDGVATGSISPASPNHLAAAAPSSFPMLGVSATTSSTHSTRTSLTNNLFASISPETSFPTRRPSNETPNSSARVTSSLAHSTTNCKITNFSKWNSSMSKSTPSVAPFSG